MIKKKKQPTQYTIFIKFVWLLHNLNKPTFSWQLNSHFFCHFSEQQIGGSAQCCTDYCLIYTLDIWLENYILTVFSLIFNRLRSFLLFWFIEINVAHVDISYITSRDKLHCGERESLEWELVRTDLCEARPRVWETSSIKHLRPGPVKITGLVLSPPHLPP